jgi:hypothetical protein
MKRKRNGEVAEKIKARRERDRHTQKRERDNRLIDREVGREREAEERKRFK